MSSHTLIVESRGAPRDLLALHRLAPARYPFLLESVAHGSSEGRFNILFAFPGETLELPARGTLSGPHSEGGGKFLDALDSWWRENRPARRQRELPFDGGWFLYLGYELAGEIEPVLELPENRGPLPTAFATHVPAAVIQDTRNGKTWLLAEQDRAELIEAMQEDLAKLNAEAVTPGGEAPPLEDLREESPQTYLDGVARIHDYIVEGDVFQANLSRGWQATLRERAQAADVYANLRRRNPGPFAGLALYRDAAVISSSPERLVRTRGEVVDTRPIAGTRPRGEGREADRAFSDELLAHPKERAEHIMLIDLERNDLGRVCRPGSVEVNQMMVLESYAHVHHIVSNVRGRLRGEVSPGQVISAVFPGGTITGCPKVRCMQILAELEAGPRGAYTGSMGYLNRDGDMDLNILIRTLVLRGDSVSLRAGAGIVADSVAEKELTETRAKARGLLLALRGSGQAPDQSPDQSTDQSPGPAPDRAAGHDTEKSA